MAKKLLVRVDDRLIHGQVLTQWVGTIGATKIVVIDDEVAQDKMRKNILKFAAPEDIQLKIYSADKAVEIWEKNQFGNGNVMVLFRDVKMIKKCQDLGLNFENVSLGQMAIMGDWKQIYRSLGFDESEARTVIELEKSGMNIYFQMSPNDGKENLNAIRSVFPCLA